MNFPLPAERSALLLTALVLQRRSLEFDESKHSRDSKGEFSGGGGDSESASDDSSSGYLDELKNSGLKTVLKRNTNYYKGAYYFPSKIAPHVAKKVGGTIEPNYHLKMPAIRLSNGERLGPKHLKTLAANRDNRPVHAAADSCLKSFTVAVRYAFARGRQAVKGASLKAAPGKAEAAVTAALKKVLPSEVKKAQKAGGDAAAKELKHLRHAELRAARDDKKPKKVKVYDDPELDLEFSFDVESEAAILWAEEHTAELIEGIASTTRQAITDAIISALKFGSDPYDDIADAVGSDARAGVIAATETMTAANEGQREMWDQAVESGQFPDGTEKAWIATSGCCDECDELDGEHVGLDEQYSGDGGDGPPLHPNCRCTEGIVGASDEQS